MKRERLTPRVSVDIIIEMDQSRIVLIERKNPPHGWALPGGFADYGESLETASVREAKEETCLDVQLLEQFHSYSNPQRDPRDHTITTVFIARASGVPKGSDDARRAESFTEKDLPSPLVFDHAQILEDYFNYKRTGRRLCGDGDLDGMGHLCIPSVAAEVKDGGKDCSFSTMKCLM